MVKGKVTILPAVGDDLHFEWVTLYTQVNVLHGRELTIPEVQGAFERTHPGYRYAWKQETGRDKLQEWAIGNISRKED